MTTLSAFALRAFEEVGRAYFAGLEACRDGSEIDPFYASDPDRRAAWIAGWQRGREQGAQCHS